MEATTDTLVDLLGETRGRIVELLHERSRSVADLADHLGLSEVAVRRHLQVLENDSLVSARTVRRAGRGRPGSRYELTDRAARLFPDHSAEFANDLLAFLEAEYGPEARAAFLRWRAERQRARYARVLAGTDGIHERVHRLVDLLSEDGFPSTVETVTRQDGRTALRLTQGHCAIREVAGEHPEVCALEARMFEELLGVGVSRRQTAAGGAGQCVCEIAVGAGAKDSAAGDGSADVRRTGASDGDEG